MTDYRAATREAALRHAVPPGMFERQIERESGFRPDARSPAGALGIAQFMPATASAFGIDPLDPLAALDAAAAYMGRLYGQYGSWRLALAAYNAGPGTVQQYGGVPPFPETRAYLDYILGPGWPEPTTEQPMPDAKTTTINADDVNFRAGPGVSFDKLHAPLKAGSAVWLTDAPPVTAEGHTWRQVSLGLVGWVAQEYLGGGGVTEPPVTPSLAFDPTTPTYFQRNPWTCSIGAVIWCLRAIGIDVTPDEAYDAMVPTYVNSDLGLLDASGAGIVKVLRDHWGIQAHAISPVTFAQVTQLAGVYPLALGLHNWGLPGGHWSGVRGFDGAQIALANPGGTSGRYGQQALTREQFEARGPASVVVLTGRI